MSRSNTTSIVTIDLTTHPPSTPLGMLLAPSANESHSSRINITLVAAWEHLPHESGKSSLLGPIQRSGSVRLGDRLVRINGRDVTDWTFREIMDTLRQLNSNEGGKRLKSLGFAPRHSTEWTRNTEFDTDANPILMGLLEGNKQVHEKRSYSFASCVGRWRVVVDDDNGDDQTNKLKELNELNVIDMREEDENDLEEHLNKEPMQYQAPSGASVANKSKSTHRSTHVPKPYIQYEIQCNLLFHPRQSFARRNSHQGSNNNYTWSVWKRYSQFRSLDAEIRSMHHWQMNALDEGRGIAFPREHYLETLWYDVYGAVNKFFFSSSAPEEKSKIINLECETENCPYPTQFVTKRQKELTTYWSQLMRIEEIFEFDINNHKFARSMASFLEVDRILMKRNASSQSVSGYSSRRPAVIHEEVEGLGELILPSSANIRIGSSRDDDDVSLLSDGTGLRDGMDFGASPLRLQQKFGGGVSSSSETSSMVSGSTMNSSKRRLGPRHSAKPAFQREFLGV